ncbi:ABC transporter permease [Paenimyroides tangerinum]|uniref:ABC transporter permease n=1 Tax=Paenimyroides tangerinum TaxID=2488728 RepID=A0A3P3WCA9_9FLAO|nr:FtsX-like permease family protein [Paenimyroides tangerinum]RRJ91957.1 ABC transporter permease [Paenimyroides tangerinum]
MKLEYFISKRLATSNEYKSSVSAPIIKIAIVAIAISIIMMLVSVSTGFGLQEKIRDKITSFNGHLTILNYDNNQSEITTVPLSLQQDFYPNFKNVPEVSKIQPFATIAGVVRTPETFEGIVYKGVSSDYDFNFISEYLKEGKLPQFSNDGMSNEILISDYLARRLKMKVGDKMQTYFMKDSGNKMPYIRSFEIVGIYDSGFKEFDETYVIGDLKHVQRLNKWDENEVGAFEIYVNDFTKINEINTKIYEDIPSDLNSISVTDKYFGIFEWMKLFDFNIYMIIGIMIIVASINMIVALLVLILERTQMIGILKALGANNWTIRKIFLLNATHIVFRGLIWGNIIGLSILLLQKYFGIIKLDPTQYYVAEAPVYLNLYYILGLNAMVILLCYIILIIPSYMITKISPVKAIKYQ